jgi:hypothetical protein
MAILPAVLLAQAIEQTHRTVARKLVALGLRELTSAADPEIISSIIAVLAIDKRQFALGRFEGRGSAHLRLLIRYRVSRGICPVALQPGDGRIPTASRQRIDNRFILQDFYLVLALVQVCETLLMIQVPVNQPAA